MKIEKTVTETLKDSKNREIQAGDIVLYREKSEQDCIGTFVGIKNGLLEMASLTTSRHYCTRPSSVVYSEVVNSGFRFTADKKKSE